MLAGHPDARFRYHIRIIQQKNSEFLLQDGHYFRQLGYLNEQNSDIRSKGTYIPVGQREL